MSAFFFPVKAAPAGAAGFEAFSCGERKFYQRQEVDPLDFAALLRDSKANPSWIVSKESHPGVPEKHFCRYYRDDGTEFFAGTISGSPFTHPGAFTRPRVVDDGGFIQ